MRRIDGKRGQEREDVAEEIVFEPGFLRLVTSGPSTRTMPASASAVAVRAIAPADPDQQRNAFGDADELLRRRQSLGAFGVDAFTHLRAQAGDADHEELIEIVGGDRQEFQPLEQRISRDWPIPPARGG